MERVKMVWLLLSSLGCLGIAGWAVSPGSGEYPELKYSVYPAPGTYRVRAEVKWFCSATCAGLLFRGKVLEVEDPKNLVNKPGIKGTARLSVDSYNRPTLVGWQP